MDARLLSLLLVAPLLAGCFSDDPVVDDEPVVETRYDAATFAEGRVQVDVPVPVVFIGFEEGTADQVAQLLPTLRPDARTYNNARLLSMGFLNSGGTTRPNPMDVTAVFEYHEAPAIRASIDAARDALTLEGGMLDAIAMEDLLATELAAAGIEITPERPGFVVLHLGNEDHSYRVQYPTGYIENVRVFGERHPFTVLDASARVDPYVGTPNAYNSPLPANGAAEALATAVEHVTWYRTLQGPIYPQSTDPCHAVTLMVVYRTTTFSQTLPSYSKAEDLLDAEYLQTAWESLLGVGRVHVDARFIGLPVDDPALEAILRERNNEALRAYMDANWDSYHVAHDGCQAYLSVFLIGDAADSGVSGIAMYDINDDRRISMSWMNDLTLFQEEDGEVGPIFYQEDPSRNRTDWVNFLFSHETGHLFGQRHPHDVSASQPPLARMSFSSIWSAMSYQQDGKMPLFGAVDTNNYWRNRAGFIAEEVALNSGTESPEFAEALELMGNHEWRAAGDVLLGIE